MTTRYCSRCDQTKSLAAFTIKRRTTNMVFSICLVCKGLHQRNVPFRQRCSEQVNSAKQRAKKFGVTNTFTRKDWFAILKCANGHCENCQANIGKENLTIEHRIPLHLGVAKAKENIAAFSYDCNKRKALATPEQFRLSELDAFKANPPKRGRPRKPKPE